VKVAELNLRDSGGFVRPIAGTIQTRTVETGQYVQAGYVMATLLQSDPMLLRFNVEPSEAPRLKNGMAVEFTMPRDAAPVHREINLVSAAADPVSHLVAITGLVGLERRAHRTGFAPARSATSRLDVAAPREAPVVPRTATRATHGYVVYTVDNDVAKEVPVTPA